MAGTAAAGDLYPRSRLLDYRRLATAKSQYGLQQAQDESTARRSRREGGGRQASDRGANPRRRQPPGLGMERASGQTHADAVLADNRLRAQGATLVLVGALSCLPHDFRRSICGPSTATHGRQLAASFRRCRVALVGHTLHSPSLSAFLTKASLTNCTTSTRGGFSGNDCPSSSDGQGGGKRRAAIPRMVAGFARGGACEELGRRAPNSSARRFVTLIFRRVGISLRRMLRFDGGSTADPNPVQNVGDQSRLKTFPRDDHRCGTAVVCSDGDSSRQGRSAD